MNYSVARERQVVPLPLLLLLLLVLAVLVAVAAVGWGDEWMKGEDLLPLLGLRLRCSRNFPLNLTSFESLAQYTCSNATS
jgi:hypothetical protein